MGKQSRREELLDAALAECVENGYAATGVKEITARAAVSHGTFYNYFDNRRELLDVLVTREVEGYMDVLRRAAFSPHPVTEDELRAQMQSVTADLIGLAMNNAALEAETLRARLMHERYSRRRDWPTRSCVTETRSLLSSARPSPGCCDEHVGGRGLLGCIRGARGGGAHDLRHPEHHGW